MQNYMKLHIIHSFNPLLHRSDQQFAINAAAFNNINNARPIFDSLNWTEDSYRMLETTAQTGQQRQICYSATGVSTFTTMYINIAMYSS